MMKVAYRRLLEEHRNAALKSGTSYRPQFRVIWPDGSIHWIASYASVLRDAAGVPEAMIGAVIDVTPMRDSEQKLEHMNRELRQLSGELLRSQDEERRRLARELHDSVGQNLIGVKLIVAGVQGADEHQRGEIAAALELLDQTLREIRTLSYLLHPPLLDDLGLTSALRCYTEGFAQRTNIAVKCEPTAELGRLERHTEMALFRIVQEALGNIHRHSGSTEARVQLRVRDGIVELTVADRGIGIRPEMLPPGHGGVGLASMRQRAAQLGGNLEIATGASGTTITVQLPVCAPPVQNTSPGGTDTRLPGPEFAVLETAPLM